MSAIVEPVPTPSWREGDDPRARFVDYLRAQLLGPIDGPHEVINDPPRVRYLLGILFPKQASLAESELEDGADLGSGDETEDVLDSPIETVNDWCPSSLGLSFFLVGAGNIDCEVWGAHYEASVVKRRRQWCRIPIFSSDAPESLTINSPGPKGGVTQSSCLDGRAVLSSLWRPYRNGFIITISLVNASTVQAVVGERSEEDRKKEDAACLHQAGFRCKPSGGEIDAYPAIGDSGRDAEDLELRLLYDHAKTFAIGHGCSVTWRKAGETAEYVETEHLPEFDVKPLIYGLKGHEEVLRLSWIVNTKVPELLAKLDAFVASYEAWIEDEKRKKVPPEFGSARDRLIGRLEEASRRMRSGLDRLRTDDVSLAAFRLANEAMLMQMFQTTDVMAGGPKEPNSFEPTSSDLSKLNRVWRPFQLAFQLLTLPSVASEKSIDREVVDLIWFPTGGGKTEAYLAMAAFALFYRRLLDKDAGAGTAVITRYTLTLLTAQQFQRAATLICACEMIRRSSPDRFGGIPFSIGLWVGDAHTPNRYSTAHEKFEELFVEGEIANPFQLQQCSWCGTRVLPEIGTEDGSDYGIRSTASSFEFFCPTTTCPFHDRLPVAVVDEELYKNPPSLLLATVDKFAQLPWDDRAGVFFGAGRHLPPSLIIQDELHLLSGPLGTTVGLYESAIDSLIRLHGGVPKVIASTATIRGAGDQIKGLFGRADTQVFPPPGLDSRNSYFARTDEAAPGRRYVGVMPQSHSTQTSVVNTLTAMLLAPLECAMQDPTLDSYWTTVAYNNSLRELGRTVTLARDDIPERLKLWASAPEFIRQLDDHDVMELRSNVGGDQLPKLLARLLEKRDEEGSAAIVACTNMFSVGVDVQRLGLMLMNGQPKSTSEYIQATSRVGRGETPGLVVVLYGATRPRDRSHYEQFISFHQSLYRNVEPTSVTPFSPQSRVRALHAALVILVRHWAGLALDEDAVLFDMRDERIQHLVRVLLKRARETDPDEHEATVQHLESLIHEWHNRASGARGARKKFFYRPESGRAHKSLLTHFGKKGEGWPTLDSMRNVDDESLLAVFGEH